MRDVSVQSDEVMLQFGWYAAQSSGQEHEVVHNMADEIVRLREALAAATRVRVTEWYAVVDKTGYVYMDHAERNRADVEEEAKLLDDASEKASPHRVVRVALVEDPALEVPRE